MKKILAIIMAICMIATVLCVPAFAALLTELDAAPVGTLLRVSALKKDGKTVVVIEDYDNFEDGWNEAMERADNEDYMKKNSYDRIIVDLYDDWTADGNYFTHDFINGSGFDWNTIYIQDGVRFTLNLNGHTIDRDLNYDLSNGEVMCIDEDADVIINNGTITGGFNYSGPGGIHIMDGANVTLNNVHIVANKSYSDQGAGIALYDGATLTMNGGSFRDNEAKGDGDYGIAVYVNDSTATFKNVEFKNNQGFDGHHFGAAIYATDSNVTMEGCTVDRNGIEDAEKGILAAVDTIRAENSTINVKNSSFTNNGGYYFIGHKNAQGKITGTTRISSLITLDDESTLTVEEGCNFSNNAAYAILRTLDDDTFYVSDSTFTNNASMVLSSGDHSDNSYFRNCAFSNNRVLDQNYPYTFNVAQNIVTFFDCSLGGAKFDDSDAEYIKHAYSSVSEEEAVIRVSTLLADGTIVSSDYYKTFADGWRAAMENAIMDDYGHVVVDLYGDWNTKEVPPASNYVVSIPENANVILNMNGHTINRNQAGTKVNGEVMYIGANANVTINDGTIKGGRSFSGAGGIHINDNARVILNNVNVVENTVKGANGAAIAVYNDAILIMNGGSLSDNYLGNDGTFMILFYAYGTLYVNDATAMLHDVTISNNHTSSEDSEGIAIYADNSTVTLNNCVVSDNGTEENSSSAESIIGAENSTIMINNTDFTGNGTVSSTLTIDYSHLFYLVGGSLTMTGGNIKNNAADKLFYFEQPANLSNVTITDNASVVLDVENSTEKVTLTNCTLGNNSPVKYNVDVIVDTKGTLVMTDCDLGDTTFSNKDYIDFGNGAGVGSIFGEGSLTMIVSILSLIASGAAIFLVVYYNKKKAVPVAANGVAETETDDEE